MNEHTYTVLGAPDNEYTLQSHYVSDGLGFIGFLAFFATAYLITCRFTRGPKSWRRQEREHIARCVKHYAKDEKLADRIKKAEWEDSA